MPNLYTLDECPDLYLDACVCDEQRGLVFMSAWGRDTAVQEFLARLTLGAAEGGIEHFHVVHEHRSIPVFVGNVDMLEKRTTRTYSILPPTYAGISPETGVSWTNQTVA